MSFFPNLKVIRTSTQISSVVDRILFTTGIEWLGLINFFMESATYKGRIHYCNSAQNNLAKYFPSSSQLHRELGGTLRHTAPPNSSTWKVVTVKGKVLFLRIFSSNYTRGIHDLKMNHSVCWWQDTSYNTKFWFNNAIDTARIPGHKFLEFCMKFNNAHS